VADSWLEIEAGLVTTRAELKKGLTRIGAVGADVVLAGAVRGELHFWDEPPKVVHLGAGEGPRINGTMVEEAPLSPDDRIEWAGVTIRYRGSVAVPVIEEIPLSPAGPGSPWAGARLPPPAPLRPAAPALAAGAPIGPELQAWARVRAGMVIDLGLCERRDAARWQEAVVRREFDADACARDVLAGARVAADDPRLLDRSGRLLRDFLMVSVTRGLKGAGRRLRAQVRGGAAMVVAQFITIFIYTAILLAVMILSRLKWGFSFDQMFDRVLGK